MITAQCSASTAQLTSPAAIAVHTGPDAEDVLLTGQVVDVDGAAIDGAVLRIWGVDVRTEEHGRFELLAYAHGAALPIPVTITASGRLPARRTVVVAADVPRLADGTVVSRHSFVLDDPSTP